MFKKTKLFKLLCYVLSFAMFNANVSFAVNELPESMSTVAGDPTYVTDGVDATLGFTTPKAITSSADFGVNSTQSFTVTGPNANAFYMHKVSGVNPTEVLGSMEANCNFFLINPNGVMFGANSRVDAPGFIASTLNIDNSKFLDEEYVFNGTGSHIENLGELMASPGGYVSLISRTIENNGTIEANLGTVALANGDVVTVEMDSEGLLSIAVDVGITTNPDSKEDAFKNGWNGTVKANGGKVLVDAKSIDGLFDSLISIENYGDDAVIEATSIEDLMGDTHKGMVKIISNQDISLGYGENLIVTDKLHLETEKSITNASVKADDVVLIAGEDIGLINSSWSNPVTVNFKNTAKVHAGRNFAASFKREGGGDLNLSDKSIIDWSANNADTFKFAYLSGGLNVNDNSWYKSAMKQIFFYSGGDLRIPYSLTAEYIYLRATL